MFGVVGGAELGAEDEKAVDVGVKDVVEIAEFHAFGDCFDQVGGVSVDGGGGLKVAGERPAAWRWSMVPT